MASSRKKSNAPAGAAGAPSAAHPAGRLNGHAPGPAATQAAVSSAPDAVQAAPDASSVAPVHPPKPFAPKLIARCKTCQSEDVLLDAWASWSFERQEWVLGHTFDHAFCVTCEAECKIECVPMPARAG